MKHSDPSSGLRPVSVWSQNGRNAAVKAVKLMTPQDEKWLKEGALIRIGNIQFRYRKGENELE